MTTNNEWDQLKTAIIGKADDAIIPPMDISLRLIDYPDIRSTRLKAKAIFDMGIKGGSFPQQVLDEANEDLETLVEFLKDQGVNVLRTDISVKPKYHYLSPRHSVFTIGNKAIAAPMALSMREDEYQSLTHALQSKELIVAPRPDRKNLYNLEAFIDLHKHRVLNETAPVFDAANLLKCNDDIYYMVSRTGNLKGAEYLQSILPDKKIHLFESLPNHTHINSNIILLREGLCLVNSDRIRDLTMLPPNLQKWDKIIVPRLYDIGKFEGYKMASPWICMNILSVNPKLVILEQHQNVLRKLIEKHGIEVAMLPMRHSRTLGIGFHNAVLDLDRIN